MYSSLPRIGSTGSYAPVDEESGPTPNLSDARATQPSGLLTQLLRNHVIALEISRNAGGRNAILAITATTPGARGAVLWERPTALLEIDASTVTTGVGYQKMLERLRQLPEKARDGPLIVLGERI
jgi:hypothetical protein